MILNTICYLQVLREQQEARREREQLRIRMMNADPFDLEAQRLIAKVRLKIFCKLPPLLRIRRKLESETL
jgi:hypothetical protein